MPTLCYPFQPGGPDRVVLQGTPGFRSTSVLVDGGPVGHFGSRREFQRGGRFPLPGGGVLAVKLDRSFLGMNVAVHYDGMPLHVLGKRPPLGVQAAGNIVLMVGVITTVFGAIQALRLHEQGLLMAQPLARILGLALLLEGVGFVVLGIFTRHGSLTALVIAVLFYAVGSIVIAVGILALDGRPHLGVIAFGIALRALILIALINGLIAMMKAKRGRDKWRAVLMQQAVPVTGRMPLVVPAPSGSVAVAKSSPPPGSQASAPPSTLPPG